jgi:hypothetical protein
VSTARVVATVGPNGRSQIAVGHEVAPVYRFGGDRSGVDPHDLEGMGASQDLTAAAEGEVVVADLWRAERSNPTGADAALNPEGFDVECPPGGSRWRVVEFGANLHRPLHATRTLDYGVILSGEITLLLEDGSVLLEAGATTVLPGVVHGWRTGPRSCRMALVQIAMDPIQGS